MLKYHFTTPSINILTGEMVAKRIVNSLISLSELDSDTPKLKSNKVLLNSELWADVAQLKWVLQSDRAINLIEFKLRLDVFYYNYEMDNIKIAISDLRTAAIEVYPFLGKIDISLLTQIIALGYEITTAVGNIPNFIDFIKSECQPINLYELLETYKELDNPQKK